jgi:hypothetical protein
MSMRRGRSAPTPLPHRPPSRLHALRDVGVRDGSARVWALLRVAARKF